MNTHSHFVVILFKTKEKTGTFAFFSPHFLCPLKVCVRTVAVFCGVTNGVLDLQPVGEKRLKRNWTKKRWLSLGGESATAPASVLEKEEEEEVEENQLSLPCHLSRCQFMRHLSDYSFEFNLTIHQKT